MASQIQAQRRIAEQQSGELDLLAELKRFQRMTVGREITMIELKKEIEHLKRSRHTAGGESPDSH